MAVAPTPPVDEAHRRQPGGVEDTAAGLAGQVHAGHLRRQAQGVLQPVVVPDQFGAPRQRPAPDLVVQAHRRGDARRIDRHFGGAAVRWRRRKWRRRGRLVAARRQAHRGAGRWRLGGRRDRLRGGRCFGPFDRRPRQRGRQGFDAEQLHRARRRRTHRHRPRWRLGDAESGIVQQQGMQRQHAGRDTACLEPAACGGCRRRGIGGGGVHRTILPPKPLSER